MAPSRVTRLGASVLLSLVLAAGFTGTALSADPTDPTLVPTASATVTTTPTPTVAPAQATTTKTGPKLPGCLPPGWDIKVPLPGCWPRDGQPTYTLPAGAVPATAVAISGTVTGPGPINLENISVYAYSDSSSNYYYAYTALNGTYSVPVPADSYTVYFYDPGGTYLHGYYSSGSSGHFNISYSSATHLVVGSSSVPGIDVQFQTPAYIRGTVTGPGGVPNLPNIEADMYSSQYSAFARTEADGTYKVPVAAGTYIAYFVDGLAYLHGYYDASVPGSHFALDEGSATSVPVGGSDVLGIDVQLPTGHLISGTVTGAPGGTPLYDVEVQAQSAAYYGYAYTATDGTYSILVPPGDDYTVSFDDWGTGTYLYGYYDSGVAGSHFTAAAGSATPVHVGTSDVPGISVQMPLAPPWSVTLTADLTIVPAGAVVTLTAATSRDVGPTPYDIMILAGDGSVVGSCGGGMSCTTTVSSATPASATYHAVVSRYDGSEVQATSDPLTVTWTTYATYVPLTPPVRMLDTRHGIGLSGKLLANTPATFAVTGGAIPGNASAVTGNVTVVNSSNSWAVYLGPNPVAHPSTSTINFAGGEVTGNGLTVALSGTGTLSATYISSAGNTTDLVFDVTGYFLPNLSGATYHAIAPTRMLDTRHANGLSGKLSANTPATFYVTSQNRPGSTIPAAAVAVTGNVTVVGETNSWAVYLGPVATATPGTSTINFTAGQVKGNSLTVALGTGGSLSATYISTAGNTTDLVFDVTGFYTADANGDVFVPMTPTRMLDTRYGNGLPGKLSANTPATFYVTSQNRPGSIVPASATAVTGNVTVVGETNSWAVFLGPDPTPAPGTSTVNFETGQVKGNGLTVALSTAGSLSATYISTAGNTTDLVLDVTGYYIPVPG